MKILRRQVSSLDLFHSVVLQVRCTLFAKVLRYILSRRNVLGVVLSFTLIRFSGCLQRKKASYVSTREFSWRRYVVES